MSTKFLIIAFGSVLLGLGLFQAIAPQQARSQEAKSPPAEKGAATKAQPATKAPAVKPPTAKTAETKPANTKPEAKSAEAKPADPKAPDAKTAEQPKPSPDLEALQATATAFETAFNKRDAKALAALFAEKAQVVDEDGGMIEGRANIETRFAELFKAHPKAKTQVEVTLLRQLSQDVAVEDGVSTVTLDPDTPASRSPYSLVHIKRDGKWLFASVRDYPEEQNDTPHDHLMQLDWLTGHWFDQNRDGHVETDCHWSEDGNYLLQNYVVKTVRGQHLKGTQRIGWDPLRRTVRAWVFDQSGAYMESTWTPLDGGWLIRAEGFTADGDAVSATRVLTPISADSYQLNTTNQLVGGELVADSAVRVVRRPPAPKPTDDKLTNEKLTGEK